ncbi:MAG: hypothetical protein M3134_00825 [Actinomycetota bacterium]|nr:hypothetical protein [Actinomycetota bacterium]
MAESWEPSLPTAQPPQILMNGKPVAQIGYTPNMPTGWQFLVLDPTKDITTPVGVGSQVDNDNSWTSYPAN